MTILATLTMMSLMAMPAAVQRAGKGKLFAQNVVEQAHRAHPEAAEIGISARSARGCRTIASTDPSDIGESCEKDDAAPMQTGKPFVGREGKSYDISLPLHDAKGRLVGSVGIELAPKPGQTESAQVAQAKAIAGEMERRILSKAALFQRSK